MSFQPSNVEVYPEKSPCDSSRASELAPAAGICLLRRETFGQELSGGQLSVSWLSATACQRSLFLPNSCKGEQGRRAASETGTRCLNSLAGAAFANICKTREETRRDGV